MAGEVTGGGGAGGQVKLPGVGPVSKRALLFGGGAAALVMGVLWWRKRHAAAAAVPASPDAVDPSLLDPGGSGMAGGGGPLVGPSPSGAPGPPATNAQWTTEAMNKLAFEDPSALSKALGLYITGRAVTPEQELLVDEARGAEGDPPVAGPNGYPPAIRTQPSGGQTNPPPPAPATTNDAWEQSALAWWQKQGYKGTTALHAQIALNDYLDGKALGAWEWWVINTTITGGTVQDWNTHKPVTYLPGIGPPPHIPLK